MDKCTVCVKKNEKFIGHLSLGKVIKFAKTVFYFFRADKYDHCEVVVKGKAVNLGDVELFECV